MGNIPVVVFPLLGKGKEDAASAAASLRSSYNNLSVVLVVGVCGALPHLLDNIETETEAEAEVLLGDVIISDKVVRYDFGSQYPDGFKLETSIEDMLSRPDKKTRNLMALLKTQQHRGKLEDNTFKLLQQLQVKVRGKKRRGMYDYPGTAHDKLFDSKYRHKHQDADACDICRICVSNADPVCKSALNLKCADLGCSNAYLIPRVRLREQQRAEEAGYMGTPALVIHIGGFGSADTVMKSVEMRDRISKSCDVIAFEMEGAGVWDELPSCIIIKGVSDYADSHNPKGWQKYAAATAASTAKALLLNHLEDRHTKGQAQHRVFYVPFAENHNFVGREGVVKSLIDKLFDKRNDRIALVGMGGIGKTQVTLRIAYMMKNEDPECSILWLPAFSMAGFEQACTDLVKKLNLSSTQDNDDARELVKQHLDSESVGQWLLILDNADSDDVLRGSEGVQGIYAYLPRSQNGQVLITARSRKIAVDFAKQNVIEITEMEHNDAKNLFQKSLSSEHLIREDHKVNELLHLLTYLPLAIVQAAAYMDMFKVHIEEYLRLCRDSQQDMMELMRNQYYDDALYHESQGAVATTWLKTFNQLRKNNTAAAKVLFFVMWIEPQAIPRSILPDVGSEQEKVKAIGTLCSLGFLRERPERKIFDMHSLVHMVMQFWARDQRIDTTTKVDVLGHLAKVFQSAEWGKRDLWRAHLPHVLHAFRAYRQIDPLPASDLGYWAGRCLLQDGRMKEAHAVLEQLAEIQETTPAQDHPYRWASQRLLATAYQTNGQIKKAVVLLEKIFKLQKAALAQNNSERLASQSDLAGAYLNDGRTREAITLLEDVVKIEATTLDQEDQSRLSSQHMLGAAYGLNGQIKQAITLLEHVVNIRGMKLPQEDRARLSSQYQLAVAYNVNGQTKEAIALLEHVVKIQEKTLDEDHPTQLESQYQLAVAYGDNGKIKEAISLLEHVVKIQEKTLDEDHPTQLESQHRLAVAYGLNSQIKEAITLLEHIAKVQGMAEVE
ncbi:hypothetical protein TrVFT333_001156 [Trichoderma virens FT-333]|nr:hypothetical protein TrVFT333_001156 [Trichoderma virens FT-333]